MERAILEEIGKKYFNAFESKDIFALASLFDESIQLTDPVINTISGKKSVVEVSINTFKKVSSIKVTKCKILVDTKTNTIIGELNIQLDKTQLEVVDIIQINDKLLITSISAYINPIKKY